MSQLQSKRQKKFNGNESVEMVIDEWVKRPRTNRMRLIHQANTTVRTRATVVTFFDKIINGHKLLEQAMPEIHHSMAATFRETAHTCRESRGGTATKECTSKNLIKSMTARVRYRPKAEKQQNEICGSNMLHVGELQRKAEQEWEKSKLTAMNMKTRTLESETDDFSQTHFDTELNSIENSKPLYSSKEIGCEKSEVLQPKNISKNSNSNENSKIISKILGDFNPEEYERKQEKSFSSHKFNSRFTSRSFRKSHYQKMFN